MKRTIISIGTTAILALMAQGVMAHGGGRGGDARAPGLFPGQGPDAYDYHGSERSSHGHDAGGYHDFPETRFHRPYRYGNYGHTRESQRNGSYATQPDYHAAGFIPNYKFLPGGYGQNGFPPFQYRLEPEMMGYRSDKPWLEPW